jgi:hypothetical protein
MKKFKENWKTNLTGIGSLLLGIAAIAKGSINEGIGMIVTAIGLFSAKDM